MERERSGYEGVFVSIDSLYSWSGQWFQRVFLDKALVTYLRVCPFRIDRVYGLTAVSRFLTIRSLINFVTGSHISRIYRNSLRVLRFYSKSSGVNYSSTEPAKRLARALATGFGKKMTPGIRGMLGCKMQGHRSKAWQQCVWWLNRWNRPSPRHTGQDEICVHLQDPKHLTGNPSSLIGQSPLEASKLSTRLGTHGLKRVLDLQAIVWHKEPIIPSPNQISNQSPTNKISSQIIKKIQHDFASEGHGKLNLSSDWSIVCFNHTS